MYDSIGYVGRLPAEFRIRNSVLFGKFVRLSGGFEGR